MKTTKKEKENLVNKLKNIKRLITVESDIMINEK